MPRGKSNNPMPGRHVAGSLAVTNLQAPHPVRVENTPDVAVPGGVAVSNFPASQVVSVPAGVAVTSSPDKDDFWVRHAIAVIAESYGDVVAVKPKDLLKFGESLLIGTTEATVMTLPAGVNSETYVSTNAITHISSSHAGDKGVVLLEGHTISGSDLTFAVQQPTLDGQNKVALVPALARGTRLANIGSAAWQGDIYVYEDDTVSGGVPTTAAKVHLIGVQAEGASLKAATAFSSQDYGLITNLYASVNRKTAGVADIRLKVRPPGGVFRTVFKRAVASDGPDLDMDLRPFYIVPKNYDVIMTAQATSGTLSVAAGFDALLALVQA